MRYDWIFPNKKDNFTVFRGITTCEGGDKYTTIYFKQ